MTIHGANRRDCLIGMLTTAHDTEVTALCVWKDK